MKTSFNLKDIVELQGILTNGEYNHELIKSFAKDLYTATNYANNDDFIQNVKDTCDKYAPKGEDLNKQAKALLTDILQSLD